MIEQATFTPKTVEIPTFDIDEVTAGNDDYIYKSYSRVSHMFNKTWLCRYPHPLKVVIDNGSRFKRDFNILLKYFDIKPVLTSVKKIQANATLERVYQVILYMLFTKEIDNKVFEYIDPLGENLEYIGWAIREYYHCTIMATPGQAVFVRDIIFKLASVVD